MSPKVQPQSPLLSRFGPDAVQYFVHISIIFLLVGGPVPGVNESHYLPKAKAAWDATFAPGDLFLESHDSHVLATAFAGILAWALPLQGVAWLGRFVAWSFMAVAWISLCNALRLPRLLSPIALATWLLLMHYGHWAGEWAVGGFEAKALAYPCALLGLSAAVRGQWNVCWIWLGIAVAWHPVVGGWIGITTATYWAFDQSQREASLLAKLRHQAPGLGIATAIGLVGAIPAAVGLGEPNRLGNIVASQIHTYYRIQHHMCPSAFERSRHWAAAFTLLLFIMATFLQKKCLQGSFKAANALLVRVAWAAVAISLAGLSIDLLLSPYFPATASKFLRFYWFRWSDVSVPLAITTTLALLLVSTCYSGKESHRQLTITGGYWVGLCLVTISIVAGLHVRYQWEKTIPESDDILVTSVGENTIATNRFVDWLAVCEWIRSSTPTDSLWFTPKYQQTFKWYAQRAEVVCWKDVPQNNRAVIEWYQRIERCSPPRDRFGVVREWKTSEILDLAKEFGFEWVLVDRSTQKTPLNLEIAYPIDIENRSFAVFRIPKAELPNSAPVTERQE